MRKFYIQNPTKEIVSALEDAKMRTATQKGIVISCPYCRHFIVKLFPDTRGHIQLKCNKCKEEMILNTLDIQFLSSK